VPYAEVEVEDYNRGRKYRAPSDYMVCLLLVGEAYLRVALNDMFAATADFQYLADDINDDDNPDGWVGSVRLTAEF
jgi:hypothetical protein